MKSLNNLVKYFTILPTEILIDFMSTYSSFIYDNAMKQMNTYVTNKTKDLSKLSVEEWNKLDKEMIHLNIRYFFHYIDLNSLEMIFLYDKDNYEKFKKFFIVNISEYSEMLNISMTNVYLNEWYEEDRGTSEYSLYKLIDLEYIKSDALYNSTEDFFISKIFYCLPYLDVLYNLRNDFKYRNIYLDKLHCYQKTIYKNKRLFEDNLEYNLNEMINFYEENNKVPSLPNFSDINMSFEDIRYILLSSTFLKNKVINLSTQSIFTETITRLKKYSSNISYFVTTNNIIADRHIIFIYFTVQNSTSKIRLRYEVLDITYRILEYYLVDNFNQIANRYYYEYIFRLNSDMLPSSLSIYKNKNYNIDELFCSDNTENLLNNLLGGR